MKIKLIIILIILTTITNLYGKVLKYPFIYIPGMFDNGDQLNKNTLLVKNLNNKDGFYYNNYFNEDYNYDKELINCSSNIVDSKYHRLIVANLIGPYRTNISLYLMANRFYALMFGESFKKVNYKKITNYKGNDYSGIYKGPVKIYYKGIIQEIWAKYGKKVYYKSKRNKNYIILNSNKNIKNLNFFINKEGYFNSPEEIKFNLVVHSSGGVALRKYMQMCRQKNRNNHINLIINLSVPQKGASMVYALKSAFPQLMKDAINNFFENRENGQIIIKNNKFSYEELISKTKISMLYGDSLKAKKMQKLIGNYILYQIPFDGYKNVLARDPALKDLHPDHRFIKSINNEKIDKDIQIINFRVKSAYSKMFQNLGKYLKLSENDGAVDFKDTDLSFLPNYKELKIDEIIVKNANHIPFPYIKPIFHLENTINQYYGFLKILLNKKYNKNKILIEALLTAIMFEFGLNIESALNEDNYSIIDYFAENPVNINKIKLQDIL